MDAALPNPDLATPAPSTPSRRHIWPGVVTLLAVLVGVALVLPWDGGGSTGQSLASEFTYADGSTGSLADFEDTPAVVHFFASWMNPEQPYLPVYDQLHNSGEGRLAVVGINHDATEADWREFVQQTQLAHPTVHQPGQEIFEQVGGVGLPTTLFVSAEGEVIHQFTGVLSSAHLRNLTRQHLGIEL